MEVYHQISIFEMLQEGIDTEAGVKLIGVCKYEKGKLNEYTADVSYADIVLLVSMLHDYVEMLKKAEDALTGYYRGRFAEIADRLEKSIEYDYKRHLEKCKERGNQNKDDRIGVGENWIGA